MAKLDPSHDVPYKGDLMLDLRDPFSLEDVADVVVYRDDKVPTAFYALPATPRVATDDLGNPQIGLIVYGRRTAAEFVPSGGFFNLTTGMQLTADEDRQVRAALGTRLAREFPQRPEERSLEPDLRAVEWLEGAADLLLVPDLRVSGQPSLFGDNQCAFSASLDADHIGPFLDAWKGGLPDAAITYRMTARAVSGNTGTARFGLEFKGPVIPPGMDPERFLTITPL
jgi:hypothetical protein